MSTLFQSSVLKKHLATQNSYQVKEAYQRFVAYFHNAERQENIRNSKEEQFQEGFLRELFVNILGYTINPEPGYNLTTELKNIKDAKKTDGAILKEDGAALAVIELKGTDTKDLDKVNDQAFNYKNNQPECVYVITSNFEKMRFFIHNAVDHEEFNLFTLTEERFALLWLFLQKDNLLGGIPAKVKEESLLQEDKITKALYADYSAFKNDLWNNMVERNQEHDPLLLYKKSQKLLDRFLFIFFSEDKGLLPPNSISAIVEQWNKLKELDEYKPLYDRFKKYFGYMNDGYKGAKYEIHAYNGGLFKADELLDGLLIDDELLKEHCLKLTNYDFADEVDTNILGHIFEHSLNDIENVRAQLAGEEVDKSKTKRKKDGVFYTPKYITKYIVDNTVGKLCEEKKAELGIDDEEFAKDRKGRKKATILKLDAQLKAYRVWLLQLTICDPACGSGAFLNQALEFLMAEHRYVDELEAQLFEGSIVFQDVENHILENNIYGVDINEESVEIARLSLWLRTAQKGRKLSSLSSNIKCGNSLIDDPEVTGDLAFNWQNEFPKVFAKGGFDVVIGNPPYVRQELLWEFKEYFESAYKVFEGTSDLFAYFYEQGFKLLGANGSFGFISNTFDKTKAAIKLRRYLQNEVEFEKYIDFTEVQIFEGATTYPIILIARNRVGANQCFDYTKVPKEKQGGVIEVELLNDTEVSQQTLNEESWSFNSVGIAGVLAKMQTHPSVRSQFGKCFRGVVTGYNEAFIIDNATKQQLEAEHGSSRELVKPFYEGKDLRKWHSEKVEKYLIFTRRGTVIDDYPAIKKFLETNKERLTPRNSPDIKVGRKSGPYEWFEIQDSVDYYKKFEVPKITWPNLQSRSKFCIESDGYYINAPSVILPSASKALLCVINSKIVWEFLKSICVVRSGGYIEVKPQYFEQIPIPEFENEEVFEIKADDVIAATAALQECQSSFLSLLQSKFDLPKPSTKLKAWPSLDFKGFLAELKKAKVPKLGLEEEAEWMNYFNKKKAEANALQSEIDRIDREIDQMVYELYGLTEEEIKVVKGN
jgi:type I restriction-modification system DNA methylase subunit